MVLAVTSMAQTSSLDVRVRIAHRFTKRGRIDGLDAILVARERVRGVQALSRHGIALGLLVTEMQPVRQLSVAAGLSPQYKT